MGSLQPGFASSDLVELVEVRSGERPTLPPALHRPVARIRSPIAEHRGWASAQTVGLEGSATALPDAGVLAGPLVRALAVALPTAIVFGPQVGLLTGIIAVACGAFRDGRDGVSFTLGDGFLPYRPDTGWPRGVREDDDVRWSWAPHGGTQQAARG
jgi:hypothetical protein